MVHTNLIANGDFWGSSLDFNAHKGVAPGDTVVLKGTYGALEFGKIKGVKFVNDGPVIVKYMAFYKGGQDISIEGTSQGAIKFTGNNFALNCEAVGKLVFRNLEFANNQMGIKVSTVPGQVYPLDYQDVQIQDCHVHDCIQEAFYIGRDELGGAWITGNILQNKVERCGRDGIQCRNGSFNINKNIVDTVGTGGEDWHAHGILIGGNTKGSWIADNQVRNAKGYGIFINGFGSHAIERNQIQSGSSGIFTKNTEYQEDLQKVGFQSFYIGQNTINAGNGIWLQSYDTNDVIRVTIRHTGNIVNGARYDVASSIDFSDVITPSPPPPATISVAMQQVPVTVTLPHIVIKSEAGIPYEVYSVSSTPRFLFGGVTTLNETKIDVSKVTNKYFNVIIKGVSYKVNK